jgi:hypothetical protein
MRRTLGVCDDTVRKWRRRFCQDGLDGLRDRPRTGRPRRFSATVVAEVKALACELPANCDVPLAKWSCPDLAVEAARRLKSPFICGLARSVSAAIIPRRRRAAQSHNWPQRRTAFPLWCVAPGPSVLSISVSEAAHHRA